MNMSTRYCGVTLVLVLGIWADTVGAQEIETAQTQGLANPRVDAVEPERADEAVKPQAAWQEVGVASWYGPRFHGKKTASGERFDQSALTAAHRSLPLGALVDVLNLANGRTVQVRINDRGPHRRGVLIDLSQGAAQALGLIHQGRGKVRLSHSPSVPD